MDRSIKLISFLFLAGVLLAGCSENAINQEDLKNYLLFQLKVPEKNLQIETESVVRLSLAIQPMGPEPARKAAREFIVAVLEYLRRDKVTDLPGEEIIFHVKMLDEADVSITFSLQLDIVKKYVKTEKIGIEIIEESSIQDNWNFYPEG